MDAMPRGGELKIRLLSPPPDNGEACQVAVEVADTGAGMSPETLSHIFDPMFTTKRIGTGAGLGLAICDQIIRQHAGTIRVESEPGRGTRFTLHLPIDCRAKMEVVASAPGVQAPSSVA